MFDWLYYWSKVRNLPPKVALKKVIKKIRCLIIDISLRRRDKLNSSFLINFNLTTPLLTRLNNQKIDVSNNDATTLALLCGYYLDHRFDLLGSGWVKVFRGMKCRGLEGQLYHISCPVQPEHDFINNTNYIEVRRIREYIRKDYLPIDWHLDFKSGYRWSPCTWFKDITYGHLPGVDIKVPWELGRMQHLPQLALAYNCSINCKKFFAPPIFYLEEFRNQVLDFIAANPPRFGVNWVCTMDVAIRIANWLLAYDIFRSSGANFDSEFDFIFHRSVFEHGIHIVNNLEWSPELRGNHYLADIAGLTFVSSYLPQSPVVDSWLAFSVQELIVETLSQFNPDGSNFEGSTAYHGLSAEIVAYSCALILGLPIQKREGMINHDATNFKILLGLKPSKLVLYSIPGHTEKSPFPPAFWDRLSGMAYFTKAITRPDGFILQIGDNDSGRFFKLRPIVRLASVESMAQNHSNLLDYREWHGQGVYPLVLSLDHSFVNTVVGALFDSFPPIDQCESIIETHEFTVISLLANGCKVKEISGTLNQQKFVCSNREISTGKNQKAFAFTSVDVDLLVEIHQESFPDFGIYIWKGKNLFLTIRCGSLGQNGHGGHSHNDQLAIELWINSCPIVIDPGTYLYTPSVIKRNQYRSVRCHFAPQFYNKGEPGSLTLGTFALGNEARAITHYVDDRRFVGEHKGYGFSVFREVIIEHDGIYIRDWHDGGNFDFVDYQSIPYSLGYGWSASNAIKPCENL